ncbi:hypothetical protein CEUSTIGMA_g1258.t1 [Chlamydomonas eustigma]|uniref:Uncharacterized protein n=1 Tax=Chlamydomonas eustigma TaxID=1157962 RepID=A0A250WSJ2_9CHLO|nr:hypothetical protein CEUSTIGMA_g1258.t1 [Chlamydomonas eustigma]|eukprot:GAX73807.1 hypothetical protein CEUSTIGMA_g1258.t1 [Chlamydomonas eustigma]
MNPPVKVDMSDPAFLVFFLSGAFSIAAGFFCIVSGTFMATHAKAAMVTETMSLIFTKQMLPCILWNHNIFLAQALLTSTQVASVCVSYMSTANWALWVGIGSCIVSLMGVITVKRSVNNVWDYMLQANEGEEPVVSK